MVKVRKERTLKELLLREVMTKRQRNSRKTFKMKSSNND